MTSDELQGMIAFAYIITTFITAFGFAYIAGEKGYSKIGYWFWCFLFGIAGWIMVAALPDRRKRNDLILRSLSLSSSSSRKLTTCLPTCIHTIFF